MEEPKITPLARRLAEENGTDRRRLQGTGRDGTLVERGGYALVAVDEALLSDPERAVERLMRGRDLPVLLPIAGLKEAFQGHDVEGYMRELVRKTIGFDIKL